MFISNSQSQQRHQQLNLLQQQCQLDSVQIEVMEYMPILIAQSFMNVFIRQPTSKVVRMDCSSMHNSSIVIGLQTLSVNHRPQKFQQHNQARRQWQQKYQRQQRRQQQQQQLQLQPNRQLPNQQRRRKKTKIFVRIKLTVSMLIRFVKNIINVIIPEQHISVNVKMALSGTQT